MYNTHAPYETGSDMGTSVSESTKHLSGNTSPVKEQLLQPGDVVGHCRVIELLAAGGMANVYKVWHEQLEVIRAVKILKPGYSEEAKGRLETEAKISANLRHPNIVEIYGMGFWNDIPYIEMEFVDGPSLKDLLEKNIRLPVQFALAVAHRVCTALQFAYNQDMTLYGKVYDRLIHRDIKPANILLSTKGVVKLADFGIARPSEVSIHTVGSKVMGTFAYLSPEQLNGEKLDQRSDVYSLGTVLYEMLTGSKTFPQKLLAELVQRKSKGQFIPVGSMGVSVSRPLCSAIEKSLALDRAKRYCDAGEFDEELTSALQKLSSKNPDDILRTYLKNPYSPGVNPRSPFNFKLFFKILSALLLTAITVALVIIVAPVINDKIEQVKTFSASLKSVADQTSRVATVPIPNPATAPTPTTEPVAKAAQRISSVKHTAAQRTQTAPMPAADPFELALKKYSLGDYSGAISALESVPESSLSPSNQSLRTIRLLQSFVNIGKYDEAQSITLNSPVSDGLFYLIKSKIAFQKNDFTAALQAARTAHTLKSEFDSGLKKKTTLQLATVLHAIYVMKPNSSNLQQALDWWSSYLANYCSDEDHSTECHEALENKSLLEQ